MSYWKFVNQDESAELRIEGDIVSDDDAWLYEWLGMDATTPNAFKEELAKNKGKPITVWIDSYGGDVFAAAGIYNALKNHDAPVTVKIDSKAMSAASVIAMAGESVLMSPVALMMIHNPLTMAAGDMHELRHVADILDEVKESIVNAYHLKSKRQRAKISEMMDEETFMSAKKAVKEGFADAMIGEDLRVENFAGLDFSSASIRKITNATNQRLIEILEERDKPPELEKVRATLALEIETL